MFTVYRLSSYITVVGFVLTLLNVSKLKVKQQFAAQWLRREIK
jgi:hypothetical protein